MNDAEHLSALIGDIYDAALNPELWTGVLGGAARFVGGPAAGLYSQDAASKTGCVHHIHGIAQRYVDLYFNKYIKINPTVTGLFFAQIGEPVATADLIPYQEFLKTRFYREWARPQGLVDTANAVLEKSLTNGTGFVVFRHRRDGVVNGETRRRMQLIVPHIRRAVLIGRVIERRTAEAEAFAATLDNLSAGMFLVDASGRIVHANVAGHLMLEASDVLCAAAGRLGARDRLADQSLRDIFAASGNSDATVVGTRGIAVPLTARDGARHVAHALPLTSGARRRAGAGYAATVALFVHKAALELPSLPEVIARHYKLTLTELRVLLAIVEVGGVPEVAEALGVARTTVKTHLGRLYEKMGAGRQADLVKLVAAFSHPFLD